MRKLSQTALEIQRRANLELSVCGRGKRNGFLSEARKFVRRGTRAPGTNRLLWRLADRPDQVRWRASWGKLTDDDLDVIAGRQDQLEGKIQERYGLAKDRARKDIEDWYVKQTWH